MSTIAYALCYKLMWILALHSIHCDWVEISQNHYTKEPDLSADTFDFTTKANRKYINQSLTERTWNRGVVDKVSFVGNIRRVPYQNIKTTALNTRNGEKNIFNEHFVGHTDYSNEDNVFISVRPNTDMSDELKRKLNTITERGITSIDQFRDNKPGANSKIPVQISVANSLSRRKIFNDTIEVLGIDKRNQITKAPSGESTKIHKVIVNDDVTLSGNGYTARNRQMHRNFYDDNVKFNNHQTVNATKVNKSPKIKLIYRENNADSSEGEFKDNNVNKEQTISSNTEQSYINYLDSIKYKSHRPQGHIESLSKFSYSKPAAYIDKIEYNIKRLNKPEDNINVNQSNNIFFNKTDEPLLKSTPNKNKFSNLKDIPNATNENTRNGIWKLVKLVTDIIYKNTHRSFDSKLKYLERLKSTILTSIEDQIDIAWPDDAIGAGAARRRRSVQARGHLEFPSSESTLMTISFLTFAVFLIKLVLQVIHTYKNKTMMVAPTVVAAVGRAAAALKQYHQST